MEAMSAEGDREQQLLDAAQALIREGRTLNISLGEVADRVGVSRSLLYVYFDGVPAIIDALFLQHMDRLAARIRHQDSPLGAESQRQFRRLLRRVAEDTRRALGLAPREAFVLLELTTGIPEALARLVRGGEIGRDTAHATCRRLVAASVDGFAVPPAS